MGILVSLNVAIGGVVHVLKAPIYLDAIGTILAALLLGLAPAIAVGVLSFVVAAILINPVYIWFVGTQAVIAAFVYLTAAKLHSFKSFGRVLGTGLALGVVAGTVSAPVIVWVFGGVSGSGRDVLTGLLVGTGQQLAKAVILSGATSEPVDKLLQCLAAFYVLRSLPKRVLAQFNAPVLQANGL